MDYAAIYERLVERARGRVRQGYMERHHVEPRCMGGSNDKNNLVFLTAKEHFLAHKLLVRMHPDVRGLWLALIAMGRISQFKARIFSSERSRAAEMRRGFKYSRDSREKMSESARARGRNSVATEFSPGLIPWNAGLPKELSHRFGKQHSPETILKMTRTQQSRKAEHSVRMRQWWAERRLALSVERAKQ